MIGIRAAGARGANALVALLVLGVGLVITDLSFAVNDIVIGAKEERPSNGYAIAETVIAAPQAALFLPLFLAISDDGAKGEPAFPLLLIPTGGVTALTTHGIWRIADDDVHPVDLRRLLTVGATSADVTAHRRRRDLVGGR
jgi:hypothetical protein